MPEFLRSTPEAQGLPSHAISAFLSRLQKDQLQLHSFMLLRHGVVVAEGWWAPYRPDLKHMMYSVSKSFTSTAVGFAVQEGLLSVQDPVVSFFPEELPENPSENLLSMTLQDLLTMRGGHDSEPWSEDQNWIKAALAWPVPHKPGTQFVYNSIGTFLVAAAVQKVTGQTLLDYLKPRLFDPLGYETPFWEVNPQGWNVGGWGLFIRTEELARWGQMMLQKGQWNGEQVLSADWVEEASRDHTGLGEDLASDWAQGYGYQIWRCRHGAYRADGAFGQFCVVMPEQDAVLAVTSGEGNMQAILNAVWDEILPHFQDHALEGNLKNQDHLQQTLKDLHLEAPQGEPTAPDSGVLEQRYDFSENLLGLKSLQLTQKGEEYSFLWEDASGRHEVLVGNNEWVHSESHIFQNVVWPHWPQDAQPWPVAAMGAWTDLHTFAFRMCMLETAFTPTIVLKFTADAVDVDVQGAIHFGPTERPVVRGHPVVQQHY